VGREVGASGEPKAGYSIQKSSHCVSIEVNKQPRLTCQPDITAKSSLTLNIALLVHPSSIIHSIVDCYEFTVHKNDANGSRPVVLSLACLDSARVWFSHQAINWVSVLANPVILR